MSYGELCLLSELANIDFTQINVITVGRVATEGPNLASGLQSARISILYSYVKPAHHPYCYHIITRLKKAAQNRTYSLCQKLIHPHNDS